MPTTYEPIATTTLGSATASITFSTISGAYTDLVLVASITGVSVATDPWIRINSDTGANFLGLGWLVMVVLLNQRVLVEQIQNFITALSLLYKTMFNK